MGTPLILELEIRPEITQKINSLHGVSEDDVMNALDNVVDSAWDHDPVRGSRLYVWGRSGRRVIFVCLRPIDEGRGEWALKTAYPDPNP